MLSSVLKAQMENLARTGAKVLIEYNTWSKNWRPRDEEVFYNLTSNGKIPTRPTWWRERRNEKSNSMSNEVSGSPILPQLVARISALGPNSFTDRTAMIPAAKECEQRNNAESWGAFCLRWVVLIVFALVFYLFLNWIIA